MADKSTSKQSKHMRLVLCEHGAQRVPYTIETRIRLQPSQSQPLTFYVIVAPCMFGYHYLAPKLAAWPNAQGVFDGGPVVVEEFARDIDDAYQWQSERDAHQAIEAWDAMIERRATSRDE